MDNEAFLPPDLARAARALTKVSARRIAKYAELTAEQVRDYERSIVSLTDDEKVRLKRSLERYGALFVAEDESGGYGVRRRYPREGFMRLNTWEGEGGLPIR